MSDVGEDYKALKETRKQKKVSRLERSINRLLDLGIEFESKNDGYHLIIKARNEIYDFYPSTGAYRMRGRAERRGVDRLISELK